MRRIGFYEVLTEITTRLKDAGCKVVSFGETDDYSRPENVVTPSASIAPSPFSIDNNKQATISLEIFIYGQNAFSKVETNQQDAPEYGEGNMVDVIAECMEIAANFVSPLTDRNIQISGEGVSGGYMSLNSSITWDPVLSEGNDDVAGVLGTASLKYTPNHSSCG